LCTTVFDDPVSILELGCGPAYIARRLTEHIPTRRLVLVDSNPAMIEIAKQTFQGYTCDVEFIESNFFQMNLTEKFDLVYSIGVVEHFDSTARAQLLRIHADHVREGGYCMVYVPTPLPSYLFFRALARCLGRWEHDDETPLSREQLVGEIRQAGLQVLDVNHVWRYYLTQVGIIANAPTKSNMGGF